ncbi:MAG: hypothetical protein A2202_06730 [Bdellovibrionales bacterium RIFOXYA1_FULL_36_14]|nr:MAG: hypothetical protein A2202_06730 [Bdellovibrionales bacterium RIFOXYA1_FULL_36_14]
MNLILYADNIDQINELFIQGVKEVILTPKNLSRFGINSFDQVKECINFVLNKKMIPVIEWDILMTENAILACSEEVLRYCDLGVKIFRVKDTGAIYFIKEKTQAQIDLIQGYSNQNIDAILFWKEYLKGRLRRLIVSQESTKEFIKSIVEKVQIPLEISLLGKILVSYTPRRLLVKYLGEADGIKDVFSLEEGASQFWALQNVHGTFLFYHKDFSLLDYLQQLKDLKIEHFRVDLRFFKASDLTLDLIKYFDTQDASGLLKIKEKFQHQLTEGFFESNSSDRVFEKLKNEHLKINKDKFVGEVIDVKKDEFLGVLIKGDYEISQNTLLSIMTPDGKEKFIKILFLKNTSWEDIASSSHASIVYINYVSGITYRSLVFVKD